MTAPAGRAYTAILDWLEEQLRSGAISTNDKLPGERALAEQFGVSRASVREAVRVMDAMGLIRSATGSGPRAGAIVVSEPAAPLGWALRMHVATRALPVRDIVDTRILLETDAARRAAVVDHPRREAVLIEAASLLDRMDDADLPSDDFHRLDAEFHVLLTSLGGNVVAETMLGSLRQATIGYVAETVPGLPDWAGVRGTLQRQHRDILDAVVARDGDTAARLLAEHIRWFYAHSRDALED